VFRIIKKAKEKILTHSKYGLLKQWKRINKKRKKS